MTTQNVILDADDAQTTRSIRDDERLPLSQYLQTDAEQESSWTIFSSDVQNDDASGASHAERSPNLSVLKQIKRFLADDASQEETFLSEDDGNFHVDYPYYDGAEDSAELWNEPRVEQLEEEQLEEEQFENELREEERLENVDRDGSEPETQLEDAIEEEEVEEIEPAEERVEELIEVAEQTLEQLEDVLTGSEEEIQDETPYEVVEELDAENNDAENNDVENADAENTEEAVDPQENIADAQELNESPNVEIDVLADATSEPTIAVDAESSACVVDFSDVLPTAFERVERREEPIELPTIQASTRTRRKRAKSETTREKYEAPQVVAQIFEQDVAQDARESNETYVADAVSNALEFEPRPETLSEPPRRDRKERSRMTIFQRFVNLVADRSNGSKEAQVERRPESIASTRASQHGVWEEKAEYGETVAFAVAPCFSDMEQFSALSSTFVALGR